MKSLHQNSKNLAVRVVRVVLSRRAPSRVLRPSLSALVVLVAVLRRARGRHARPHRGVNLHPSHVARARHPRAFAPARARAASPRLSSSSAPSVFAIGRYPTRVDECINPCAPTDASGEDTSRRAGATSPRMGAMASAMALILIEFSTYLTLFRTMCTEIANAFCPARASRANTRRRRRRTEGGEPTTTRRRTTDDGRDATHTATRRRPSTTRDRRHGEDQGRQGGQEAREAREAGQESARGGGDDDDEEEAEDGASGDERRRRRETRTKGTRTNARARSRRWARESDGRGRED